MQLDDWGDLKKMIIRLIIPLAVAYTLIFIIIGFII